MTDQINVWLVVVRYVNQRLHFSGCWRLLSEISYGMLSPWGSAVREELIRYRFMYAKMSDILRIYIALSLSIYIVFTVARAVSVGQKSIVGPEIDVNRIFPILEFRKVWSEILAEVGRVLTFCHRALTFQLGNT